MCAREAGCLAGESPSGRVRRCTTEEHCPGRGREAIARLFDRIGTPPKVQKLQRALYGKAKAEPKYRFYSLYGELLRPEVLEPAMRAVAANDGAAGVDGQSCSIHTSSDERWEQWRDQLLEELRTKSYRASPVRRVYIAQRRREAEATGHPGKCPPAGRHGS